MDNNTNYFYDLIVKALEFYDDKLLHYKTYLDTNYDDVEINWTLFTIDFINGDNKKKFSFERLGYFDIQYNIWIWAWVLSDFKATNEITCKYLLEYGIKQERDNFIIKSMLVNSRIQIEDDIQLDINLAIYNYLLKDRIKFIYPYKKFIDRERQKYIIYYLLII